MTHTIDTSSGTLVQLWPSSSWGGNGGSPAQPSLAQHALLPMHSALGIVRCLGPSHTVLYSSGCFDGELGRLLGTVSQLCGSPRPTAVPESLVSEPSHEPSDQPHP